MDVGSQSETAPMVRDHGMLSTRTTGQAGGCAISCDAGELTGALGKRGITGNR